MQNLLVAQSGGPTAAINATLFGVLKKACENESRIGCVYAARFGIKGVLREDIFNLSKVVSKDVAKLLLQTPASCLGSCRHKLKDFEEEQEEYEKILEVFLKYDIKYFVYIGGNDSMDTVLKISEFLKEKQILDIFIVGAPKTIDNDLVLTDHCPGFGSAAKFVATTFAELERDCAVYDVEAVTLVETMGRDSGWLTAASCLSRVNGACGPSLIYCCEQSFSVEKFLEDVEEKLKEKPDLLVALSEGLKNEKDEYIFKINNKTKDMFGHSSNAGVAKFLADVVKKNLGCKVRAIELNSPQRAASHLASKTDIEEAVLVGEKAVELAIENKTKVMVTILRKKEDYEVEFGCALVEKIANKVKLMPEDFFQKNKRDVSYKAVRYLKPLIRGELKIEYKNGVPVFLNVV